MIRIPSPRGPSAFRLGYLAVLCFATLVPFGLDPDLGRAADRFVQGLSPALDASDYVDAARNVVLFAGWGLLWTLTASSRRGARLILGAALSGAAISVGLEGLQLFSEVRHTNVLDVLTNTAGALLGSAATVLLVRSFRSRRGARSYLGLPALSFLLGYGVAVLVEAAFPVLRPDLLPIWGGPVDRLLGAIDAFDAASVSLLPWLEGILFLPAGALCVATLAEETEMGYRRAAVLTAAFGAAAMAAVEVVHGAASYPIQLGPFLVHAAALTAGAVLTALSLPAVTRHLRGRRRPLAFLVLYVVLVLLWVWRPFDLIPFRPEALAGELEPRRFIPLSAHSIRNDLYSVADVVQLFALHLPLGALLAAWPLRRSGPLRGLLPALYLAAAGEVGQILVASRFFDITDLLIAAAGAAVGWAVMERADLPRRGQLLGGTND